MARELMDCPACHFDNPAGAKHCQECGSPLPVASDGAKKLGQSQAEIELVEQLTKAFAGKYRIERKLGSGGMAEIYEGRHVALGSSVAIKVLSNPFNRDEDMVRRFFREARSAAALKHPNIINIQDVGQANDVHYLVMDYVDGRDLKCFISENPHVDVLRAIDIILPVTRALAYAHSRGVVHRDIKPANIMIDRHGTPLVMDFGIAKVRDATTQLTQQGSLIGTPRYMSPEQCKGEEVTRQSDIYSLGIVFYQLLAGRVPFEGSDSLSVLYQHINSVPSPIGDLRKGLPEGLQKIVSRMLEKDLPKRYQDADSLIFDFEQLKAEMVADRHRTATAQMAAVTQAPPATAVPKSLSVSPTLSPKTVAPPQSTASATASATAPATPPISAPQPQPSTPAALTAPARPAPPLPLPAKKKSRGPAVALVTIFLIGGGAVTAWYLLGSPSSFFGGSKTSTAPASESTASNPNSKPAAAASNTQVAGGTANERMSELRNTLKRVTVDHSHGSGSCRGTLTIAPSYVSFQPDSNRAHQFQKRLDQIEDYIGKGRRLTIKFADGKHDFDLPSPADLNEAVQKIKQFSGK